MSAAGRMWLVALREMRERSRSRAFQVSLVMMVLIVVAVIALPAALEGDAKPKDVGLTGAVPEELPATIETQSQAVGPQSVIHRYHDLAAGERAVRDGDIDVLVVDAEHLEWRRDVDEQLEAVLAGAIQLVAVEARATEAGIDPDDLLAVVEPVPITNVELGQVQGRGPDDETAAFIMTVALFMAISTYGAMVMSGVVEEKSSRVVEVLLARMPARDLLAGKILGIGLLGLGQIALTVLAALAALTMMDSVDVPAARGAVLAWAAAWFVLGFALYATVFGALGALASRTEDTSSAGGAVGVVLVVGYFVSFAAIGSPDTIWAKVVSYFPVTAPLAMPNRLAMGAADWWEPLLAAALTIAAIAGLIVLGGRVYTGGILHSGPTLTVRAAWHGPAVPSHALTTTEAIRRAEPARDAAVVPGDAAPTRVVLIVIAVVLGGIVFTLAGDVVIGLGAGAALYALATSALKAWGRPVRRPSTPSDSEPESISRQRPG